MLESLSPALPSLVKKILTLGDDLSDLAADTHALDEAWVNALAVSRLYDK